MERFARIPARAAAAACLGGADFRVLIAIGSYADPTGRAFPSMDALSKVTGIRRGDIPRSIRRLEGAGLLRRDRKAGAGTANIYTIEIADRGVSEIADRGVSEIADRVSARLLQSVRNLADLTESNKEENRFPKAASAAPTLGKQVYALGKKLLGSGGQVTKLINRHGGDLAAAMGTLELAGGKAEPKSYVAAILRGESEPETDWDAEYLRLGVS